MQHTMKKITKSSPNYIEAWRRRAGVHVKTPRRDLRLKQKEKDQL